MDINDKKSAMHGQSYTILRIKRKRAEGPLDALAVESRVRRKKSRGSVGVFQFAQTVENDAWQDEQLQKDLKSRISRLAHETSTSVPSQPADVSPPTSPIRRQEKDDSNRRYSIIVPDDAKSGTGRLPTSPHKAVVSPDSPPKSKSPDFTVYDAVLSAENPNVFETDSEMDKFMPMLNDYLKLHHITPDPPPMVPKSTAVINNSPPSTTSHVDDYVWDVFYHRPATLSEWNEAANVGTLTGLPPSITDPYDSPSESEEEDEMDEDSNAEEYYKNDYPDEEELSSADSDGSDVFHEDSDHGELFHE